MDLLLLNVPGPTSKPRFALPPGFDDRSWPAFQALYRRRRVHVFGCWHETVPAIRLECYPRRVLERILGLRRFVVRRLKRGPIAPKRCVLRGTDGTRRSVIITPEPLGGGMFSTVPNVLAHRDVVFIGMHLDRLLTSMPMVSTARVLALRQQALRTIGRSIARHVPASNRFAREPERIFFSHARFSPHVKQALRAHLSARPPAHA